MTHSSRILIVDDEPFNVDYLEQELEDLGYATASARNGLEALDKVTAQAPDLILLDVMMPIMDGFTVCHILKGNDETRMIPIVIMTALDGFDDRIKGEVLNETNGTQPLAIHMGLNSGLALVGSTRLEGVRGTRWTFTASGPVTNLAARLAATAGVGQLMVGQETVRRLGDSFRLERLGHASLKNLDEAVEICRVLGPARATF